MGETGILKREIAIYVLRAHGVGVIAQQDSLPDMLVLAKGDVLEARRLPEYLGRQLIHYLARKFDIPIHHFYHPELFLAPPETPLQ